MYNCPSKCCIEGDIGGFILWKFKLDIPTSFTITLNMSSRAISMDIIFKFELYKLWINLKTLIYPKCLLKISICIFILIILIIGVVVIFFILTTSLFKLILYFIMFFFTSLSFCSSFSSSLFSSFFCCLNSLIICSNFSLFNCGGSNGFLLIL